MWEKKLGQIKMAVPSFLLLFIGCLMASSFDGISSSEPPFNESVPSAEALKSGCSSDADCGDNEYCFGRGSGKQRCRECFNCDGVKRKSPMKTYDGDVCAKHQRDCGECYPGYTDLGGVCVPQGQGNSLHKPTFSPTLASTLHNEINEEEIHSAGIVTGVVTFALISVVGLVGFVLFYGTKYIKSHRHESLRDEETSGLFNRSFCDPTAPPVTAAEYEQQPSSYQPHVENHFLNFTRPSLPGKVSSDHVNALPFNIGNGAGEWRVSDGSIPLQHQPTPNDQIDHNHIDHYPINNEQPQPQQGASGNSVNNQPAIPVPIVHAQGAIVNINQTNQAVETRENDSNQPRQNRNSLPPQSSSFDPIVGQFRLHFTFEGQIGNVSPSQGNPTANQSGIMISAPASPRMMDDTHMDLSNLQGSFTTSNSSFDSGTGTGDHDRSIQSVPSRSMSGNDVHTFSDADESFFDQDVNSQLPPQPGSPQGVPENDIEEGYEFEE